jgi:hypothetical protein
MRRVKVKEGKKKKDDGMRVEEDERRSKSPDSPGLRKVGWMDGKMERWGWGWMGDDAVQLELAQSGPIRAGRAGAESVQQVSSGCSLVWRWAWRILGPGQVSSVRSG